MFENIMFFRGEVVCSVTTAKALDAGMAKEVEASLAGFLKAGEKAQISFKVSSIIVVFLYIQGVSLFLFHLVFGVFNP